MVTPHGVDRIRGQLAETERGAVHQAELTLLSQVYGYTPSTPKRNGHTKYRRQRRSHVVRNLDDGIHGIAAGQALGKPLWPQRRRGLLPELVEPLDQQYKLTGVNHDQAA